MIGFVVKLACLLRCGLWLWLWLWWWWWALYVYSYRTVCMVKLHIPDQARKELKRCRP